MNIIEEFTINLVLVVIVYCIITFPHILYIIFDWGIVYPHIFLIISGFISAVIATMITKHLKNKI
jgi:hypothetical protein